MSSTPDSHGDETVRETPSQGIFMGYLALALMVFAIVVALTGILAGATHGWQ